MSERAPDMDVRRRAFRRLLAVAGIAVALGAGLAGSAAASPAIPGIPDCKDAPVAQLPGGGVTGVLDEGPSTAPKPLDPFVTNPRTSVYEQYGYAGLGWHTYDLGCGGGMRDVEASIDTATGNLFLSAATWGTSATNGIHNKVSHPEQYMAPLDEVVTAVTQRLHNSIWSPWGATALVGVGALLLFYSASGRLSSVASGAAWAMLVLSIMAGLAQYPTRVATFFDSAVTSSVASINTGVAGLSNLPPSSDPARAQGAVVVDRVLYDNWLRGELGDVDSPAAKRWGPKLFKATAFTWAEAEQADKDPDAGRKLADRKAESFKKVAAEIEKDDPVAYGYLQGKSGGRAGTGLMTMFGSLFTGLFRLVADVFLFAGLVMLRLLVMMFPAIAVVGVMSPMAAVVRRVFSMGGSSVVNVIAFSAGSAVHTTVVSAILTRSGSVGMGVLALVLCFVVTLAAFVIMFPLLSFSSILGQSRDGHRLLKRGSREVVNYFSRREAVKDGNVTANQQPQQQPVSGEGNTGPQDSGPHRRTRMVNLPAESFGRPAPTSAFPPVHPSERVIDAPDHVAVATIEGPLVGHAPSSTEGSAATHNSDPAYDLAGTEQPSRIHPSDSVVDRHSPSVVTVRGVLVDRIPEGVPELPNLAHDSHTLYRRDGVGPRVYDPATKQTQLSVAHGAKE